MLARFDGSFLESQVAPLSYQDNKVMPQNLPDIMLDNLKKQYPELNSLESIYDDVAALPEGSVLFYDMGTVNSRLQSRIPASGRRHSRMTPEVGRFPGRDTKIPA